MIFIDLPISVDSDGFSMQLSVLILRGVRGEQVVTIF